MAYGLTAGGAIPQAECDRPAPTLERLEAIAGTIEQQLGRLQQAVDRFHGVSQMNRKDDEKGPSVSGYSGQIDRLYSQADRLYNVVNEIEQIL